MPNVKVCGYCPEKIFWAVNRVTGKKIPLIAAGETLWEINGSGEMCRQRTMYRNHFETCPGADLARKGKDD